MGKFAVFQYAPTRIPLYSGLIEAQWTAFTMHGIFLARVIENFNGNHYDLNKIKYLHD